MRKITVRLHTTRPYPWIQLKHKQIRQLRPPQHVSAISVVDFYAGMYVYMCLCVTRVTVKCWGVSNDKCEGHILYECALWRP